MKPFLIISAILEEHKTIKKLLKQSKSLKPSSYGEMSGKIGDVNVILAFSSMGMPAATKAAKVLVEKDKYSGVLVTGYCGGLSIPLKVGDVVIPLRIISTPSSGPGFEMDHQIVEELGRAVILQGHKYRAVPLITVPKVIESPREKEALLRSTNAEAVDMETAEVVRVCKERGVPVYSLKVIIDDCQQQLPDFNSHFEKTGKMDQLSVAGAFMAHPMLAMQLTKNMKRAAVVLQDILPSVLKVLALKRGVKLKV